MRGLAILEACIAAGKAGAAQLFLLIRLTDMIVFPILFDAAAAMEGPAGVSRASEDQQPGRRSKRQN